jgi:hypothetical protein
MLEATNDTLLVPLPPPEPPEGGGHRLRLVTERGGVEPSEVEDLPFDLSVLAEEGIVVDVDARGTTLFDATLDLSDLGVSWQHGHRSPIKPVRCELVPADTKKGLLLPSSRGHGALARYSYRFLVLEVVTHSASNRWVPWRAWPEFRDTFDACCSALERARAEYRDKHPVIVERMAEVFGLLAADSARRLRSTSGVEVAPDFEGRFVEKMLERIPAPEEVEEKLTLRLRVRPLRLGSEMLAERARATEERARLEAAEARVRAERESAHARNRVQQAELWAQEERIRRQLSEEKREIRREAEVKQELARLKLEAAREQLAETVNPLVEGAQQLRAAVYESATAIREALAAGHLETKKVAEMARLYRLLNFTSEPELDALLGEVERLALEARAEGKRRRRDEPIDRVLGEIIERRYAGARAMTERTRASAIQF